MIFKLKSYTNSAGISCTVLIPQAGMDAWDMYEILNAAFPYNEETYQRNFWNFFIINFGGYENALEFTN